MSLSVPIISSFPTVWSYVDSEMGVLTCMVASPAGTRVIIASKKNTAAFFNSCTGRNEVTVSFEHQFFVKTAVWYSENHLIIGCSNGSLYYVCLSPSLKGFAVTMCSILKEQLPHQIRALALNLEEQTLAVGYGTTVSLMKRILKSEGNGTWDLTQRIPGLVHDKSGLVASLLYFPGPSDRLSLLVLYTESGFGIWKASGDFSVIAASSETCRVGDASITPKADTLAISTLDQTLVTYPLVQAGPVLIGKREYVYPEQVSHYPIVPVGITENGLAFGGTTNGRVPVISTHDEKVQSLIQHEDENHIIRMISTLTDRIIIGSTNPSTNASVIKCYALCTNTAELSTVNQSASNTLRITVTEAMLGWRDVDCAWPTSDENKSTTIGEMRLQVQGNNEEKGRKNEPTKGRIYITRKTMFATGFAILAIMLTISPPNAEPFDGGRYESDGTAVLKPTMERHNYWILYGLRYSAQYFEYQVTGWTFCLLNAAYAIVVFLVMLAPLVINLIGKLIGKLGGMGKAGLLISNADHTTCCFGRRLGTSQTLATPLPCLDSLLLHSTHAWNSLAERKAVRYDRASPANLLENMQHYQTGRCYSDYSAQATRTPLSQEMHHEKGGFPTPRGVLIETRLDSCVIEVKFAQLPSLNSPGADCRF
ncbi:unnamed protein product [Rhizoctonia solani]|nr:unnamed protein product [Rhizoctonia solani]